MTEKTGRRIFQIGAGLLLLTGLVHSISLFAERAPANDTERQLQLLMDTYRLNLLGSMRTMSELMRGFSISFMLGILAMAAADFAVAGQSTALMKRVAVVNAVWLALMIAVSLRYFFIVPLSFLVACFIPFAIVSLAASAIDTK
jgi:hypothetical protein